MTVVIDNNTLPSTQMNSKSIFTIRRMVLADRDVQGSFVGSPLTPLIRVGGLEVRLFTYEGQTPQYQLILTNFHGKLIWFRHDPPTCGWYTLTNVLTQRSLIDSLLCESTIVECIERHICESQTQLLPTPPNSIGSTTVGRISERHKGKAYCGFELKREHIKWV